MVANYIKAHGTATKSEILRLMYRNVDEYALDNALKNLFSMQCVSAKRTENGDWVYEWKEGMLN